MWHRGLTEQKTNMKTYDIQGEFNSENEVVIKITESVTPPPIEKTQDVTVGAIKARVLQIESDIVRLEAEKSEWQSILDTNQSKINDATK